MKLLLVATLCALVGLSVSYPSAAPSQACGTMLPRHGYRNSPQDHSQNPAPFAVTIEGGFDTYSPEQVFQVTVHSTDSSTMIKGFLLEARTISGNPPGPVGQFINPGRGTKIICDEKAVTHFRTWRVLGDKFHATWQAPAEDIGEIVFVTTVVKTFSVYWSNVRSIVIRPNQVTTTTPAPAISQVGGSVCDETRLLTLPTQRPHVAILCDAHAQCPCGWLCCPSCAMTNCTGHAICRQPVIENVDDDEDDKSSGDVERRRPASAKPAPTAFVYVPEW